jgi:hypothetical protein
MQGYPFFISEVARFSIRGFSGGGVFPNPGTLQVKKGRKPEFSALGKASIGRNQLYFVSSTEILILPMMAMIGAISSGM